MPKKLSKKEIQRKFVALMNSCMEGRTGEWDPTGEGAESFDPMYWDLQKLAKHFGVNVSEAKELPDG